MPTINTDQIFAPSAHAAKHVKLDTSDIPELSAFPQGVYGIFTIPINESGSGATNTAENTAYQDTPFNDQVDVLSSSAQITENANKGWMTLSVDPNTSDVIYIGDNGVTTNNGYKVSPSNPTITVSSDDLSEWFVIGDSGGETLYIVGAYLS